MLDEADRLLNMDFEQEIDQILKVSNPSNPCNPVCSCENLVAIINAIDVVAACRGIARPCTVATTPSGRYSGKALLAGCVQIVISRRA